MSRVSAGHIGRSRPAGLAPRPYVPRVVRPQHTHTGCLQLVGHASHSTEPTRHRAEEIELVAVVDADVGVTAGVQASASWFGHTGKGAWEKRGRSSRGPNQHGVNPAIAHLQVGEVSPHGVTARLWVVEVAIIWVCLRLDIGSLCPLQSRILEIPSDKPKLFQCRITVGTELGDPRRVGSRGRRGRSRYFTGLADHATGGLCKRAVVEQLPGSRARN